MSFLGGLFWTKGAFQVMQFPGPLVELKGPSHDVEQVREKKQVSYHGKITNNKKSFRNFSHKNTQFILWNPLLQHCGSRLECLTAMALVLSLPDAIRFGNSFPAS